MTETLTGKPTNQEVFGSFFPDATITNCELTDLPQIATSYFTDRNIIYTRKLGPIKPGDFSAFLQIDYSNGEKTYVARQTKSYENGGTDELHYLIDLNSDEIKVGIGEIGWVLIPRKPEYAKLFINKPFVYASYAMDGFYRKGYGTRRLRIMNAICQMSYGLPLNSSERPSDMQLRRWNKLVELGEAEKYTDKAGKDTYSRFRFKS